MPEPVNPYEPPAQPEGLVPRPQAVSDPNRVPFAGELSAREFHEWLRLVRPLWRGVFLWALYGLIAIGLPTIGVVTAYEFHAYGRAVSIGLYPAAFLLSVCVGLPLGKFIVRVRVHRLQKRRRSPFHHREGYVSREMIWAKSNTTTSTVEWNLFESYRSSPNMVVLVIDMPTRQGLVFPRSHFASDADWRALPEIVHERLPPG